MPGHSHNYSGQILIATGDRDVRIVMLRKRDGLDAVGDELPRLKGEPHALCSHGDGIGDTNSIVLPANESLLLYRLFHRPPQVKYCMIDENLAVEWKDIDSQCMLGAVNP